MIDSTHIEDDLTQIEFDLAAAGDLAGAHMVGNILQGFRDGSTTPQVAVLTIDAAHARLRRQIVSGGQLPQGCGTTEEG